MSRSYIRDTDIDWSEYLSEDDENVYELYDQFEQNDKRRIRKRQTKMRNYEGYVEDDE